MLYDWFVVLAIEDVDYAVIVLLVLHGSPLFDILIYFYRISERLFI